MTTTQQRLEAPPLRRRRTTRPRLTVVVGLVLVAGLVVAGRWWTAPDVFPDASATMSVVPKPVDRAAIVVGLTAPDADDQEGPRELVFTDEATVELAVDTARATTEVAVCRARPGAGLIGAVPAGGLGAACERLEPVRDGVRMTQGSWDAGHRDYLVVTLRPTAPGVVRLTEVSLSYRTDRSHHWRRGTEPLAVDMRVPAR